MSVPVPDRRIEVGDRGRARKARIDDDQLGASFCAFASVTHLKPHGWASAALPPITRTTSAFLMSVPTCWSSRHGRMSGPDWPPSGRVKHALGCRTPACPCCARPCRSDSRVSLLAADAANMPVVSQRLTVVPSSVFSTKFASRSSFISFAMRSSASSHEMRCHRSEPAARYSGYFRRLGLWMKSIRLAPFRAQRAAIDRVVRVTLDMDDFELALTRVVRRRIDQHAAAHRAVRAGGARFLGLNEPEEASPGPIPAPQPLRSRGHRSRCLPRRPRPVHELSSETSMFMGRLPLGDH